jgi:hypothetical protein
MSENTEAMSNEVLDVDIDSDWGDDDSDFSVAQEETTEVIDKDSPEERQGGETAPAVDENTQADQPKMFTIKNRDEVRQVSESDLIAMAQKGWDYDNVRQERDQLRNERAANAKIMSVVQRFAKNSGHENLDQYADFCMRQEYLAKGMTEQQADYEVRRQNYEADLRNREAKIEAAERLQTSEAQRQKQAAEARRKDIQEFTQAYPEVKPESVPKEVWAQVAKGTSLINAYTMHENRRLQAELAAERQNKINQKVSPGSLGGNAITDDEEFDRMWCGDDD